MPAKRDFGTLQSQLAPLAATQPTQRPPEPPPPLSVVPAAPARVKAPAQSEKPIQQAFALRPSLRKQLHQLAAEADETVQTFILKALRAQGLNVTDADLIDRRKVRA